MSKPYWSGTRGGNTYADDDPNSDDYARTPYSSSYAAPASSGSYDGFDTGSTDVLDFDDYDNDADYGYRDNRWRWIAGTAAVVLFITVVAIATVLGNDSATSTSTTETSGENAAPTHDSAPASSTAPRTVIATVPPAAPGESLAPETVVTVTPTPSASHPAPPAAPPPAEGTDPARTITYTVTGNRQLFDLVTVIYTDEQGFPRTDVNVALPWSRTVVLNPGVETQSVTATSITGQLNCSITDGAGATILAQNNNSLIATCTK